MEDLKQRFGQVCDFVKVYVSEAHPVDEWKVYSDVDYCQPTTLAERMEASRRLLAENEFISAPLVLDGMDNQAEQLYAAHPERLYVITRGTVAYKGGKGPFGYQPKELAKFLETL
mmetsp:Transcript_16422/g.39080  ORF Transcript_16422/g.39080 Transcript_16422/m.39080 type:complete len:115 (-) Transcript_16422:110-454(-)